MNTSPNLFDQVSKTVEELGVEQTLDLLEGHFRRGREYFKLFEILKLRCRHNLDLPLIPKQQPEQLPERKQRDLDDGLIDACQTVGTLLFRDGKIQHGWAYLQPAGNRKLAESLIREVAVTDDNVEILIDIALGQGGAPAYGYQLLIQHHGTCNAITAFDVQGSQYDRSTQRAMASGLLRHLYNEVIENVRGHIVKEKETPRSDATLSELLSEHPWLVEQQAYHLDTTHLASVMRIARLTTDSTDLELALQLAQYGAGLPQDLQHPSPPPFEKTYADHQLFFRAMLGEEVDRAIEHFQNKVKNIDRVQYGTDADEAFIDLCFRLNRVDEAIEHATALANDGPATGQAPDVIEMAQTTKQFQTVLDHLRKQDDLLGFALARLRQHGS